MTGTGLARMDAITQSFVAARPKLAEVVPQGIDIDRLMRTAQMAISGNDKLMKCTTSSLLVAFMEAARLGLEIGGAGPGAHIVPFGTTATVIVDYRGFMDLAYRAGSIRKGQARVVYDGDEFDTEYGLNERLYHKPNWGGQRGPLTHVYCILTLASGERLFEVMDRTDIDKIRRTAKGADKPDSPWVQWFERMALKSVVRYTVNRWVRKDPTVRDAINLDVRAERGLAPPRRIEDVGPVVLTPDEETPNPPSGTETALDRIRARAEQQGSAVPAAPEEPDDSPLTDAELVELDRLMVAAVEQTKLGMEEAEIWEEAKNTPERDGSPGIVREAILTLRERLGTEVSA